MNFIALTAVYFQAQHNLLRRLAAQSEPSSIHVATARCIATDLILFCSTRSPSGGEGLIGAGRAAELQRTIEQLTARPTTLTVGVVLGSATAAEVEPPMAGPSSLPAAGPKQGPGLDNPTSPTSPAAAAAPPSETETPLPAVVASGVAEADISNPAGAAAANTGSTSGLAADERPAAAAAAAAEPAATVGVAHASAASLVPAEAAATPASAAVGGGLISERAGEDAGRVLLEAAVLGSPTVRSPVPAGGGAVMLQNPDGSEVCMLLTSDLDRAAAAKAAQEAAKREAMELAQATYEVCKGRDLRL